MMEAMLEFQNTETQNRSVYTKAIVVTPQIAGNILKNNGANRKLNKKLIERYANDMKLGNWQFTHQGVAIAKNGTLLDGQHRLTAIVKCGVAVPMLVTWNIDHDGHAMGYMVDAGLKRSAADIIGINRESVASATTLIKIAGLGSKPTASEINSVVQKVPEIIECADFLYVSKMFIGSSAFASAATLAVLNDVPIEWAKKQFITIQNGVFGKMTPRMEAFYRYMSRNKIPSSYEGRVELINRSLPVFIPSEQSKESCRENPGLVEKCLVALKDRIKQ